MPPGPDWDECRDAPAMLRRLRELAGDRKLRLLACACARARWSGLVHDELREGIEVAENFADGLATREALRAADEAITATTFGVPDGDPEALRLAGLCTDNFPADAAASALARYSGDGPAMIREIFGDPTRRIALAIKDEAIVSLAQQIYQDRRFDRLPELADLLAAAGCPQDQVLAHLRAPGPHHRGCWALDAVLGKGQGPAPFTETQWYAASRPFHMLRWWAYRRDQPGPRKQRLLAAACCRLRWRDLGQHGLEDAVKAAETFADDQRDADTLRALHEPLRRLSEVGGKALATMSSADTGWDEARRTSHLHSAIADLTDPDPSSLGNAMHYSAHDGGHGHDTDDAGQAELVREVLGNPFQSVRIDPAWLTWKNGAVLELARKVYDERAFVHMPRIADLLRAAGCRDAELLSHFQQHRGHVRGCWALDAVLGKN